MAGASGQVLTWQETRWHTLPAMTDTVNYTSEVVYGHVRIAHRILPVRSSIQSLNLKHYYLSCMGPPCNTVKVLSFVFLVLHIPIPP